jgi:thioredoxin 1
LETLAREYGESLLILKVDVDAHPDAAQAYSVTSLPTLVLFRDGGEVKRHVGAANLKVLQAFAASPAPTTPTAP